MKKLTYALLILCSSVYASDETEIVQPDTPDTHVVQQAQKIEIKPVEIEHPFAHKTDTVEMGTNKTYNVSTIATAGSLGLAAGLFFGKHRVISTALIGANGYYHYSSQLVSPTIVEGAHIIKNATTKEELISGFKKVGSGVAQTGQDALQAIQTYLEH